MYNIDNKVIVVTGGASGIGYAIADKFLENNAKVAVLLDFNETKGFKAVEGLTAKYGAGKAFFIKCDVRTDLEEVSAKIMSEYEQVDVLVNSAGIASEIIPKHVLDINLVALVEWSIKFREYMNKTNGKCGGAIFNIASIMGLAPFRVTPVYCASKYGVVGFSRSLGHLVNFDTSGVRVFAICPSFTRTALLEDFNTVKVLEQNAEFLKGVIWQDASAVGDAVVEVYKNADSGTVWIVDAGNLSEFTTKDYQIKRQEKCD